MSKEALEIRDDVNLPEELENEILGQLGTNGDQIDIEKLAKVYEVTKTQERENQKSEKELQLKEREIDLREAELKQNKIGTVLDIVGKVSLGVLFAALTIVTQKKDQDFQKEGFGYDNETSKRSQNALNNFKSLF